MENINKEFEYDECIVKGGCSINPILSSVHEVILIYLEELAFYLLELDTFGAHNEKIKSDIIDFFSAIIENIEYNQENLNKVISALYEELYQAKELYTDFCKKNNITINYLKSAIKISKKFTVTEAIKQGQRFLLKKDKMFTEEQKKNNEALLIILKSICIYMVELRDLKVNIDEAYKKLLMALNIMNFDKISAQKIDETIKEFVRLDYELMQKKFNVRKEAFGAFISTEVSTSTRKGKAILVSGSNLKELELILEATKDRGIDIYTHGQMLIAHALPKLKVYPNLVGHYGKGFEHYLSDFSSFDGAIFLSRLSLNNVEHLYRSRIFTTDVIAPKGVTIIKDKDFEPLLQSALSSEGITKDEEYKSIKLGIDEEEFIQKVNEVADKIEKNEIKHVFMIGVPNRTEAQRKYMEEFLELLEDDCFAFSFTHANDKDNIFFANVDYAFPFVGEALDIFIKRNVFEKSTPIIFYTRCELHTVPIVFNMKYMGIDDIYFADCSPTLVNPALIEAIRGMLDLKHYTNPRSDFRTIVAKKVSDS